jgi:hypothetical protein
MIIKESVVYEGIEYRHGDIVRFCRGVNRHGEKVINTGTIKFGIYKEYGEDTNDDEHLGWYVEYFSGDEMQRDTLPDMAFSIIR